MLLIESEMKDKAPTTYQRLKGLGELEKVLIQRAEMAEASFAAAHNRALDEGSKPGLSHPDSLNLLTQARNEAAAEALRQAVEFAESPPDEAVISTRLSED